MMKTFIRHGVLIAALGIVFTVSLIAGASFVTRQSSGVTMNSLNHSQVLLAGGGGDGGQESHGGKGGGSGSGGGGGKHG